MFYSKYSLLLLVLQQMFIIVVLLCEALNLDALVTGSLIALLGASLKIWCQSHDIWSSGAPASGPFLWVRQPNISGDILICLGLMVTSSSPWFALGLLAATVSVLRLKVQDIELFRHRKLGIRYAKYANEVPLIFPNRIMFRRQEKGRRRPLRAVIFEKNQRGILQLLTLAGFFVIGLLKHYLFPLDRWPLFAFVLAYMVLVISWYLRLGRSGQLVRH